MRTTHRILLRYLSGMMVMLTFLADSMAAPDAYSRGVDWLSRYGYLPPPDPMVGKLQTKEGLEKAIREMQRFGGIEQTGKLDRKTLELMSKPRCSLPDIMGTEDRMRRRRRKRYALSGLKWTNKNLSWKVLNIPRAGNIQKDLGLVENIMTYAFKAWSDVTPLKFTMETSGKVDMEVSFTTRHHEDGYPFDGHGGTLAHAFFPGESPISGDTHFDDEEEWGYRDTSGTTTDLFTVAVHEFGHALGLAHSADAESIMAPYYSGPKATDIRNYILPSDDQQAIQRLYGPKEKNPTFVTPPLPDLPEPSPPRGTVKPDPSVPNRCQGSFDAVANIRGEVFFFKGKFFWRRVQAGSLLSNVPALIKNFWYGLPDDITKIDAVYERSDSHIIFFSGQKYWVFNNNKALPGYPRPITEWGMTHSNGRPVTTVEAAFVWAHNGRTVLFSGQEYWGFSPGNDIGNPKPDKGYPKAASLWAGVPSDPDDVITFGEGGTYFFKDNSYWIIENGRLGQDRVTSKSTATEWMKCSQKEAPTPRPGRGDCSCALNGASEIAPLRNQWISLILTVTFLQILFMI